MNVFNEPVMQELNDLAGRIESDSSIRAVIFRGGKETGFLAGADVTRVETVQTPQEAEQLSQAGQAVFARIERLKTPTFAAIHGQCLGGGLEFALACRYRLAMDDSRTRLGLPEIELGILPGWGGTQRLPRLIGLAPALRIILETKKLHGARGRIRWDSSTPVRSLLISSDALVKQFVAQVLAGKAPSA